MSQRARADQLRSLHAGPEVLVLPNAWDAISARVVEAAGFPAITTTSAGLAAVLGYPDGQRIPQHEMLFLVRKIARTVAIPVSADVEAGYSDPVQTALDLIDCGAVGMNLEDEVGGQLLPLSTQVETIRTIRSVTSREGVPMVINARTDIFLAKHGDPATRFDRAVERLNAFHTAGADCLFAPGVHDPETIGRLAQAVQGPLNVLAGAGSPSIPQMKALGVRRVSLGSGPSRVALGGFRRFLNTLQSEGTFEGLANEAIPFPEIQQLLTR
jgi:2-methylisocitrate lyase-like PEP mutase family enzyme